MKLQLFKIDSRTHLAEINKEWISTIKEFRAILKRDKGSEGDSEGRAKLQATREFTFIFHYCDYGSKYVNYSEKDKRVNALRNANLPTDTDIEKDRELMSAIEVYKVLQYTPSLKLLNELKEGMHTSYLVVKKIREALNTKLETIDLNVFDEDEEEGSKKVDPVKRITAMLESLVKISNTLPVTLTTLEELEEKVKKELSDDTGIRGDREKGEKEDGGSDTSNVAKNLMRKD